MAKKKYTLAQRKADEYCRKPGNWYWRNKADRKWSEIVRFLYHGQCAVKGCKCAVKLNSHHILSKESYAEFRYDINNGILLCPSHHKFGLLSAHGSGIWFADLLARQEKGKHRLAVSRSQKSSKLSDCDYNYKNEYEKLLEIERKLV